MTFESTSLLLAKIGFLAILTMLIVFAGTNQSHEQAQTMQLSGH